MKRTILACLLVGFAAWLVGGAIASAQKTSSEAEVAKTASAEVEKKEDEKKKSDPVIKNDAVLLGILLAMLAFVFVTSSSDSIGWKRFYAFIPPLFVCYFLPSLLTNTNLADPSASKLYFVASRYLLPTSLVFLTLSTDLKGILRLGPKALILFLTGTVSIVLGGPIAFWIVSMVQPEWTAAQGPEAVWRGMTTLAGSWIGGGANQAAMKEMFHAADSTFGAFVAVDVIVANVWMALLLLFAANRRRVDERLGADSSAIDELQEQMATYQAQVSRIPNLRDTILILALGFGITAVAHAIADVIAPWIRANSENLKRLGMGSEFFWLVFISTAAGLSLSFTRARALEGVGASRFGSVFIYVLVATIGMKMDLRGIWENAHLFILGFIWMGIHVAAMLIVCRWIRAPIFFLCVGSKANIGGAASAPIIASAFHPALAPVGVLLAVLGYTLGTVGAWLCGYVMSVMTGEPIDLSGPPPTSK